MADDQTQTSTETDADKAAENKFWDEHKTRTKALLDEWFEEKVKTAKGNSDSRNGGRSTLPSLLADVFFPVKK